MHITPKLRDALLAALAAPGHTLVRGRGGFVAAPGQPAHTLRIINQLDHALLVELEPREFPHRVALTCRGLAMARELADKKDTPRAKAVQQ